VNAFAPIKEAPPSAPVAPAPLFKFHPELYWSGFGFDVVTVFICLCSLYLSAVAENHAPLFVVVIQGAVALSELGRAPLAYLARTHSSPAWRGGCAAGVVGLGFVTAFNLFMPLNQSMRERIAPAQEAAALLEEAEALPQKLREEISGDRSDYNAAQGRVKDANAALASLPAKHCSWCNNDPRMAAMRTELVAATSEVANTKKKLDNAEKRLREAEGPKGASVSRKLQDDKRHAVNSNMVYGAVATILGIDPAKIPPNGMSWALRLMTMTVCAAAGLLGSLICLASVERIAPPKKRSAERLEILKEGAALMTREASAELVKEFADGFKAANAAANTPAPAADNETKQPPSPLGEASAEFLTKARRVRGPGKKKAAKERRSRKLALEH
jgi:hypothetical protein